MNTPIVCRQYLRSILLTLCVCLHLLAAGEPGLLSPAQVEQIEAAVAKKMAAANIPGLSVAVVVNNKLALSKGFGFADIENHIPAKATTIYRWASISKPVTATAVMQLAERGRLNPDAAVQQYCPSFPQKQWPITVRALLMHQGGIRHYKGKEEIDNTRYYPDVASGLSIFKDDPLLFEPGTNFAYSSYGYNLLGCVIEGASGIRYADYITQNIFRPAAMSTAQVDEVSAIIENRSRGYVIENGHVSNAHLLDSSYKIPSGGWCSSVEDLANFAIALFGNQVLLPDATLRQMWTPQGPSGEQSRYGLGWQLSEKNGVHEVFHTGGQQGTSTILLLVPAQKLAVVVMANLEAAKPSELARQISAIVGQPAGPQALK